MRRADAEREALVQAFGAGNLRGMLRALMVESPRGRAYFTQGEGGLAASGDDRGVCTEEPPASDRAAAVAAMERVCVKCHQTGMPPSFIDANGAFDPEHALREDGEVTDARRGALWQKIYCAVATGRMQPRYAQEKLTADERAKATCHLRRARDELARGGTIPAVYLEKVCEAASGNPRGAAHGGGEL